MTIWSHVNSGTEWRGSGGRDPPRRAARAPPRLPPAAVAPQPVRPPRPFHRRGGWRGGDGAFRRTLRLVGPGIVRAQSARRPAPIRDMPAAAGGRVRPAGGGGRLPPAAGPRRQRPRRSGRHWPPTRCWRPWWRPPRRQVPGIPSTPPSAVRVVLGQQVSVTAAGTLASRLAVAAGEPVEARGRAHPAVSPPRPPSLRSTRRCWPCRPAEDLGAHAGRALADGTVGTGHRPRPSARRADRPARHRAVDPAVIAMPTWATPTPSLPPTSACGWRRGRGPASAAPRW